MNPRVLSVDAPELFDAVHEILETGGVLIFPTDTVYGIGGSPWDEGALARVRALKGRPADQPFTLHLPGRDWIARVAQLDQRTREIVDHFLPGPYTFLLPALPGAPVSAVMDRKVGVRVPGHPFFSHVLARLNRALFGTSVNRSGELPLVDLATIIEEFSGVDLIVTGPITIGTPSAVIDLTTDPPIAIRGTLPEGLR